MTTSHNRSFPKYAITLRITSVILLRENMDIGDCDDSYGEGAQMRWRAFEAAREANQVTRTMGSRQAIP